MIIYLIFTYLYIFRILLLQDRKRVDIFQYVAGKGLKKVYKPENASDWSGLHWHNKSTTVPREAPPCGWQGELCVDDERSNTVVITIVIAVGSCTLFASIIAMLVYRRHVYLYEGSLKSMQGIVIPWKQLEQSDCNNCDDSQNLQTGTELMVVSYKDEEAVVNHLSELAVDLDDKHVLLELKQMRNLSSDNVNPFVGICNEPPNVCVLMTYAARGRLCDIIADQASLSIDFKLSFIQDIAGGVLYLHQSPIEAHGHLTSATCVVDKRWTCKITDYGLRYIKQQLGKHSKGGNKYLTEQTENGLKQPSELFWKAPELFDIQNICFLQAQKGDVYSFAIIAQEIFMKDVPYAANVPQLEPSVIIEKVKNSSGLTPYRPHLPDDICSDRWTKLIQDCWVESADKRPTFKQILHRINSNHKYKSLVDKMIKHLARYTENLEEKVSQRVMELRDEKLKVDILLSELLPQSVAEKLTAGIKVEPESFDCVTVFFSDIVGFTKISSEPQSTPMQVVLMLNAMYAMFDDIAHQFDVYKVATIGDAYLMASGVPIRNGNNHAAEICGMALVLLEVIHKFAIPHIEDEYLRMRLGIHSGPCVAGVAGVKMPRYLLFGDTVDIAARMESGGEAMKIHISETTERLIKDNQQFKCEKRGEMDIKGQKILITYWLEKQC